MIVLNGFVKIHRKLIQWGWYKNSPIKDTFLHLLLTANFKDMEWEDTTIKRGQVITSYKNLASDTGLTVQQVRTAISKLKSTGEITSESTNKFTLITLVNYEEYQCIDEIKTSEITSTSTNNQQTTNKQTTNEQQQRKNDKNDKNIKKHIKKYGEFENVILSDDELQKLKNDFSDYEERIERLSGYIASSGKKYKSHYATIRQWAARDKKDVKKSQKIDYENQELF